MERGRHAIGKLNAAVVSDNLIEKTMEYVWKCLVPWRDDPDRSFAEGEEELNGQFHDFLESSARENFPMVFFRHEQRQTENRRVDLSAKPVDKVSILGVTYTKYEPILVIEGKRLPAPSNSREREYVTGENKASGGIQRFKLGLHGKDHRLAIMLGYLQQGTPRHWLQTINEWISELAQSDPGKWSEKDALSECPGVKTTGCGKAVSDHPRAGGCVSQEVRLFHFWVQMPPNSGGESEDK